MDSQIHSNSWTNLQIRNISNLKSSKRLWNTGKNYSQQKQESWNPWSISSLNYTPSWNLTPCGAQQVATPLNVQRAVLLPKLPRAVLGRTCCADTGVITGVVSEDNQAVMKHLAHPCFLPFTCQYKGKASPDVVGQKCHVSCLALNYQRCPFFNTRNHRPVCTWALGLLTNLGRCQDSWRPLHPTTVLYDKNLRILYAERV